jgi:hypothetical protein
MKLPALAMTCALLLGCAQQPAAIAPAPPSAPLALDPQRCGVRADCTTKVSRTLLFVFDYAAAGGALVERRERLLFTPAEAPPSDWPALRIQLAAPTDSRFEFSAQCRGQGCRYSDQQLLRIYRSYLAGQPCVLGAGREFEDCVAP